MSAAPLDVEWSAAAYRRFDLVCAIVGARRKGLTLQQLADAGALARALEYPVDEPLVEAMARRLELTFEDLAGL